jgi:hypothetical protein
MLREIMITRCADRALLVLFAVGTNSIRIVSCHFHESAYLNDPLEIRNLCVLSMGCCVRTESQYHTTWHSTRIQKLRFIHVINTKKYCS